MSCLNEFIYYASYATKPYRISLFIHIMPSPVLGDDQQLWMRVYGQINLNEWRLEVLGYDPSDAAATWNNRYRAYVYVGNSSQDPQRHEKLLQNKYCFWPEPPPVLPDAP